MSSSIVLCSKDGSLAQFCREVLAELFGAEWKLVVISNGDSFPDYSLCIRDFDPGVTALPDIFNPSDLSKHLFVVHREHLSIVQERLGTRNLNVLLKPVTHATLGAFLEGTCRRTAERKITPGMRLRVERDEMLQYLIQANLKLQEYDQERTNFLARSIHDFRAPLTALTGYCGLLLDEELSAMIGDPREIVMRMQRSAMRLSRMAEGMFQLSVAQLREQKPAMEKADIRDCIGQALNEVGPFVESKRLVITTDVTPPPESLCFERSQIEQMLINLLDNACKFTPRLGSIGVKGYPFFWERRIRHAARLDPSSDRRMKQVGDPNSFRIDIRDSGPGIPEIHLKRIFEEYTSYSGAQDRSGGGLGLAIAKMIAHRHQGRIWAESSPAGAVFSFVLPLRHTENIASGGGCEAI